MGSVVSKTPKRRFPAPRSAGSPSSGASETKPVEPPDVEAAVADLRRKESGGRPPGNLESDLPQLKDSDLASLLDQIGGSIQGRAVAEGPTGKIRARRATEEEKEARLKGRIPIIAVRDILEQQQQANVSGTDLNIPALAQKYGADEETLRKVLRYHRLPILEKLEDGRLIAR
ncbi:hypothetical protein WJX74_010011 [Apatococcus lobatus]|uniref:DNA-binding protein n=2 Tax=Apatococcus TaxID=904362 RepID=A0AAW1SQ78_9CHLO